MSHATTFCEPQPTVFADAQRLADGGITANAAVLASPHSAVASSFSVLFDATPAKHTGRIAGPTLVANAKFAQSYRHHARRVRRGQKSL